MTLALVKSDPSDSGAWMPVGTAAIKMQCNVGHLRRKCVAWEKVGLAKRESGAWHVHISVDPKLQNRGNWQSNDVKQLAELTAQGLPTKYIKIAQSRRELIADFAAFSLKHQRLPARKQRELYLAAIQGGPSVTQFYRWQSDFEADGLRGLVPASAFRQSKMSSIGESALEYIERVLNAGNRISLSLATTLARGEASKFPDNPAWFIPSYRTVALMLQSRRTAIMDTMANKGEKAARAYCVPKIPRDFDSIIAGDWYCGDERTLDWWAQVYTSRGWRAMRLKLTAWSDMRSRAIVGWILRPYADTNTILGALKIAVRTYGKPHRLLTDHGRDYKKLAKHGKLKDDNCLREYDGERVGSILDDLGIECIKTSGPYMPYAKPIESFFRTMKQQLDSLMASFWGGHQFERHEERSDYLHDNMEKLPTLEECSEYMAEYIRQFHATPHGAHDLRDKTPMQALAAFRSEPVRRESDKVLNHVFKTFSDKTKKVHRDGIKFLGRWYGNGDQRLTAMPKNTRVVVAYQPDDISTITVCNIDRSPMFDIECLAVRGRTERELKEMIRDRRRMLKPFADQAKAARKWFEAQHPSELLDTRGKGIEAQHGKRVVTAEPAPSALRVRPALEEAIDTAGAAPSESIKQKSKRLRTGTDGLSIHDMCEGDSQGQSPSQTDDSFSMDDFLGD